MLKKDWMGGRCDFSGKIILKQPKLTLGHLRSKTIIGRTVLQEEEVAYPKALG